MAKPYTSHVIIPSTMRNSPEPHEIELAHILSQHFQTSVEFLIAMDTYRRKTPDVRIGNMLWEMKSPKGESRLNTIRKQFQRASSQSRYLVIDTKYTKLSDLSIENQIVHLLRTRPTRMQKVIIVNKERKVIELKR